MAKMFSYEKTPWAQKMYQIDEIVGHEWPFQTVDRDEVTKAFKELVEAANDAHERKINGKKVPVEALLDRVTGATLNVLRHVRAMEYEAVAEEMESLMRWENHMPYRVDFLAMQSMISFAQTEMYSFNNRGCDAIAAELEEKGIKNRYIDIENEKSYATDIHVDFAENATTAHYHAMAAAYEEVENLIKYGLPSESTIGKKADSIIGSDEHKKQNQTIVDRILRSEADLETVRMYILPELERRVRQTEALAKVEERRYKYTFFPDPEDRIKTYYFRAEYGRTLAARDAVTDALALMQAREKTLEGDYKLTIKREGSSLTCDITATHSTGIKLDTGERTVDRAFGLQTSSQVIKERHHKEQSITMKVGRESQRLYEEEKKRSSTAMGYSKLDRLKGKKISLKSTLDLKVWHSEVVARRTTKMTGKGSIALSAKLDPLKAERKVTFQGKKKEREILKLTAGLGNMFASLDTKTGIPVVKAGFKAIGAEASALGVIKASMSAGGAAFDTAPAIKKMMTKAFMDDLMRPSELSPLGVVDSFLEEARKKFSEPPSPSFSTYKSSISLGGIGLHSTEYKDGQFQHKSQAADLAEAWAPYVAPLIDESIADPEIDTSEPEPTVSPEDQAAIEAIESFYGVSEPAIEIGQKHNVAELTDLDVLFDEVEHDDFDQTFHTR